MAEEIATPVALYRGKRGGLARSLVNKVARLIRVVLWPFVRVILTAPPAGTASASLQAVRAHPLREPPNRDRAALLWRER